VLGSLKSVAVAPAELEAAFDEGIGFDGSSIEGFARVYEADMLAKPDPTTFQVLPWASGSPSVGRMFCDILMPDGSPSYADPRWVLKRTMARAADMGFSFYTHPEIEFYLFTNETNSNGEPVPVDSMGYFDHSPNGPGRDFRRQAILMLESMGISVEFSHHEGGPGQQEIDLRYADALSMADNIMTFRLVIKEVALQQGVRASFMPKPLRDFPGSGMHTHLSLFEGEKNAFHEAGAPLQLSKIGRAFIAGLLRHAPEITAVTNQWVNSYKRIIGGAEAPAYVCWGHNNRSALVRVPMYKPGKGQSTRVEYRAPDSATNPYLAYALLLAAGLRGIEQNYQLPEGAEDDVWALTDGERRALGMTPLPTSLNQAITAMENSELVAETLGEHVFDFFLRNKREEWRDYRRQVTEWERERYLPVL
jgi:glutamine synthetase